MQELSIRQLQAKMTSGQLTSEMLVKSFLARIDALDHQINAIIELNPDALDIAKQLDIERNSSIVRGPMHGIPVLLKDNINTGDQMQTTAGSLALAGNIAKEDAFVVARLRDAGAIILGKTNLSEWANFRGHQSTSGWSSRGGLTRNPYVLDRSACGSSSGSAVAVASNFCTVAVGTETDGSVICPAQTNGIVGLKPTLGLLSRSGIIPIAHSQDTAGPMARTVEDVAILLQAMTGVDNNDPVTLFSVDHADHYLSNLTRTGLKGARIGIARNMTGTNKAGLEILQSAIQSLQKQGAIVIDNVVVPNIGQFVDSELKVLHYEFKEGLNNYLANLSSELEVHDIDDVIAFNKRQKDKVMPFFGQQHLIMAAEKEGLNSESYKSALAKCKLLAGEQGLDAALDKFQLDALVTLSGGPSWTIDLVNGDSHPWDTSSTSAAAVAGYPHITVPAGYINDLPIGLSFIGTAWQEAKLLKYAYAFEQSIIIRKPPAFKKTIG